MKQASISFAVVLAVTLSVAGVVPALAQPVGATADGPVVAVVVDDAHVRFVDTVQMRRVIRDVVDRLLPDGSLMSLASTGRWSTPLDPTFEKGKVDGKVNQLMGLGPTPADASQLPSTDIARRAQLTSQTLADVVSSMASISNRRKVIVLVSSGAVLNTLTANERRELQATFAAVAASASRAGITLLAVDPRDFGDRPFSGPDTTVGERHAALRALTGTPVIADQPALDAAIRQVLSQAEPRTTRR